MAGGQLKYRCPTVGVIPFGGDLHLEQSPSACHSALAQEIEADSKLMRKANRPNFYETRPKEVPATLATLSPRFSLITLSVTVEYERGLWQQH